MERATILNGSDYCCFSVELVLLGSDLEGQKGVNKLRKQQKHIIVSSIAKLP